MPFWLKFKWRMAHSRSVERGTANRPPHSRFAVWWCTPSPPFTSSSTPSPRCLLHFERLRVNTTHSILPSIHTSTSATSLPPPLRLNTLPSTLPSIHTSNSATSLPPPLRLNTVHSTLPSIDPSILAPLQSPCLLHFASSPYLPLSHPSTLAPLQSPCLIHFASTPYITFSIHPHLPLVRHHGRLVRRPPLRPRRGAGREVRVERRVVEVFAATAEVHHYCAPRQKESQSPLFAAAPPPPQPPPPKGCASLPREPHHPFEIGINSFLYESG